MSRGLPHAVGSLVLACASAGVVGVANARRVAPPRVEQARVGLAVSAPEIEVPTAAATPAPLDEGAGCSIDDRGSGRYGPREKLRTGSVRIPRPAPTDTYDLLVHLHGGAAAERLLLPLDLDLVVVTVDAGVGSKAYAHALWGPEPFEEIVEDVATRLAPARLGNLLVSSWSAGYGGVREILSHHPASVDALVLLDSVHAGYTGTGEVQRAGLLPFFAFAYRAAAQDAVLVWTHSSIQPPGYASTTEVADALLEELDAQRSYGGLEPRHGVEIKTRVERGNLTVMGTTGTNESAHCAHLRMLPEILREQVLPALTRQ